MNEDTLKQVFSDLLKEGKYIPAEAMSILGRLIHLTLEFRDRWKDKTGEILTIDDTRQALDIYITARQKTRIPNDLPARIDGLAKFWLKQIDGVNY